MHSHESTAQCTHTRSVFVPKKSSRVMRKSIARSKLQPEYGMNVLAEVAHVESGDVARVVWQFSEVILPIPRSTTANCSPAS